MIFKNQTRVMRASFSRKGEEATKAGKGFLPASAIT
jgi:hypothetical protein